MGYVNYWAFSCCAYLVSDDSSDQVDGIVRHSSPAWVNLNINQMKHDVNHNYGQMMQMSVSVSRPEHVSSEHTLLVLQPTEAGAEGGHVPLSHVEGGVHDGLVVLLGGLLECENGELRKEVITIVYRAVPSISLWPRTRR